MKWGKPGTLLYPTVAAEPYMQCTELSSAGTALMRDLGKSQQI